MPIELLGGIPLAILIIGTLYLRRIIEPACLASIVATILLYHENFVNGYIKEMYQVLSNTSFQLLIIVGMGFTGISALLEASGAMLGFRTILEKKCTTKSRTLFFTWLLGAIIFIDDYLNALAVSASMKGISDKMKIPREHLAYTTNCMGACVCVILPFSSWASFAIGCINQQGFGIKEYILSIPFMFYPICATIISLLLSLDKLPKIGELKKAYQRENSINLDISNQATKSSILNFIIPMLALIVGMLIFDKNIIAGIFISIIVMLFMYKIQNLMKITEFFDIFLKGCTSMTPMIISIFFTFIMQKCIEELGFTNFLTILMSTSVPAYLLPVFAFLSVSCITFFTASFWSLIVISFPIFLPMATAMNVNPTLIIGAIMSGVALGSQTCLYSDAIFMVASGTNVSNDVQVKVVFPYAIMGLIPATLFFLVSGFIK